MKNPRFNRIIQAAMKRPGYSEDGPEKQETRHLLVHAASAELARVPMTAFTYPGMQGLCALLFRQTWPHLRIIGLDRQAPTARLTKSHWYGHQTAVGIIENEMFHGSLRDYAVRNSQRMRRRFRSGRQEQVWNFDFPSFDLMFIDSTARYDMPENIDEIAATIDGHAASPAVVGVTVVIGNKKQTAAIDEFVKDFRHRVKRRTKVIDAPMNYFTNASMLFFILRVA